jgi:transcription elongation factor
MTLPCFSMSDTRQLRAIREISWVRIKSGKYRLRLGLVRSVDFDSSTAIVLVVPRTHPLRKKRARKGDYQMPDRNLVDLTLPLADLSDIGVNATPEELEAFKQSNCELVTPALVKETTVLQIGDRIRVISGDLRGMKGIIVNTHDDHTITYDQTDVEAPLKACRIDKLHVCKDFRLGHYVHIKHGRFRGEEGFVTEINGNFSVMVSNPRSQREVSGESL